MRIRHEEPVLPSERSRHQLYEEVKEALSVESADELLAYLPPVGWADVAAKSDLGMIRHEMDALRTEMRGDTAELRGELRSGMTELRSEMALMRSEIDDRFSQVDGRFDAVIAQTNGGFDALQGQLTAEIAKAKDSMRVWTIATMLTMIFGMTGMIFAIARIGH